jgi:hypothetical protein
VSEAFSPVIRWTTTLPVDFPLISLLVFTIPHNNECTTHFRYFSVFNYETTALGLA